MPDKIFGLTLILNFIDRGHSLRLQLRKVGNNNPFTKVTEFVLNLDDAKAYLYKDSTKHRIHRWNDLKVNIYV